MPSHNRDAYLLAFHYLYCEKKTPIEAARETGIHPQVIERAATGYMNPNEGRQGRLAFLEWCRGLRSSEGVPCCGGQLLAGDRPVVGMSALITEKINQLQQEIEQLRRGLPQPGRAA